MRQACAGRTPPPPMMHADTLRLCSKRLQANKASEHNMFSGKIVFWSGYGKPTDGTYIECDPQKLQVPLATAVRSSQGLGTGQFKHL